MKKIASILMIAVLALSCFTIFASAVDVDAAHTGTLTIGTVEAMPGDTVTVDVVLTNNPGIFSYTLTPVYDTTRLELVSTALNKDLWPSSLTVGKRLVWIGEDADITADGVMFTFTFNVLAEAPAGDAEVSLEWAMGDVCNYDEEDIDFDLTPGKVVVGGAEEDTTAPGTPVAPSIPELVWPEGECAIGVQSVAANAGDTVTVDVLVNNNPGIFSYTLTPVYDTTRLELVSTALNKDLWPSSLTVGKRLVWIGEDADITADGVMFTFTFNVLTDAADGNAEVSIGYAMGDICNYDEEDVLPVIVPGYVVIGNGEGGETPCTHENVTTTTVDATCTVAGSVTVTCDDCGEVVSVEEIAATGHTAVVDPAVAPTCTATGLTEGSHCGVCNEVLVAQTVVAATGHTAVVDPAVAPTCTATGLTEGSHCGVCNEVLVAQTVVAAKGHTEVAGESKDPTCTQPGFGAGTYCAVCGEVLSAQDPIPALGHQYSDAFVGPTCTEQGYYTHTCTVCGDTYKDNYVDAMGHNDNGASATCTEATYCAVCGVEVEKALGHNYIPDVTVPTCTTAGYTTYNCNQCGDYYVDDHVAALGHQNISEATCYDAPTCGVCGKAVGAALGHVEVYDAGYMATCTTPGLTDGSHCDRCEEVITAQEEIPAMGHTEVVDEAVEATCTETGLTAGKHCDVCGETLVAQTVVAAKGHKEHTIPGLAATCTENGYTDATACERCHLILVEPVEIAAKGHTEVVVAAKAPTCTETGLAEGKVCSVCNDILVPQNVVAALGHTEVVDAAVAPTCTATGLTEGKHCSVCDEVFVAQQIVDALGHTEVIDAAVAPTCTETGLTEGAHCDVCGETLVAQTVVPANGHTPGAEATETTDQVCTVCGDVLVEAGNIDKYKVVLGENFAIVVTMQKPIASADTVTVKISGIGGAASGFYTWNNVEVDLEANTITIKGIAATYVNRDFKVSVAGGKTMTVSIGEYCDTSVGLATTTAAVKAVCEQINTYADMAENYFRQTSHAATVKAYDAGDAKRVVSNATAEGAATFYSAYLALEDGVYMMVSMQNYTDEAISVTIGGNATTDFEVVDIDGKATIKLAIKADRYNDTIVFKVGDSTLTYSVDAYIKAKQNDANTALVNLVNALGNYGKTVRDYSGKTDRENNQTEDDIL